MVSNVSFLKHAMLPPRNRTLFTNPINSCISIRKIKRLVPKNWKFSKSLSRGVTLMDFHVCGEVNLWATIVQRPTILGSYWSAGTCWIQNDTGERITVCAKRIKLFWCSLVENDCSPVDLFSSKVMRCSLIELGIPLLCITSNYSANYTELLHLKNTMCGV